MVKNSLYAVVHVGVGSLWNKSSSLPGVPSTPVIKLQSIHFLAFYDCRLFLSIFVKKVYIYIFITVYTLLFLTWFTYYGRCEIHPCCYM